MPAGCNYGGPGTVLLFGFGEKTGALGITQAGLFGPEVGFLGLAGNGLFALVLWRRVVARGR